MTDYPRSPYVKLGGYVHLPRLIDKARLFRQGSLHGYNYRNRGFDKHLLAFLGIDGEQFERAANELSTDAEILDWVRSHGVHHAPEEIEQWNRAMIARRPDNPEKIARFQHILAEAGGAGRTDIQTYFDLIDLEEGRIP
jgi:Domain of unknown function (DUF5069)